MTVLLQPAAVAVVLLGLAVLVAVAGAILPSSPARRRDALKALELLLQRRLRRWFQGR
jgi:hypothetical protein